MDGKFLGMGKNPKRRVGVRMALEVKGEREEVRNGRGRVLWVGNLWGVGREEVWDEVRKFGAEEVMMGIGWSGRDKGFAHVRFRTVEAATEALEGLKGKEWMGQLVKVDYAREGRDGEEAVAMLGVSASDEIWIGNCWGVGVSEVWEALRRFRPVSVRVGSWRDGRGRWHVSVKFESVEEARRAIEGLEGKVIVREPVRVGFAARLERWQDVKAWYGGRAGLRLGIVGQEGRWKGDVAQRNTRGGNCGRGTTRGYGLRQAASPGRSRSNSASRGRGRERGGRKQMVRSPHYSRGYYRTQYSLQICSCIDHKFNPQILPYAKILDQDRSTTVCSKA